MPLQITGRHMSISEEQREYLEKKVQRLRRTCPKIDELSFTLTKEKVHFEAEGNFRAGRIAVTAVVSASKPLEAIDALVDKMEAQITKAKAKMTERNKSENPDKASARQSADEAIEEEVEEEEVEEKVV